MEVAGCIEKCVCNIVGGARLTARSFVEWQSEVNEPRVESLRNKIADFR